MLTQCPECKGNVSLAATSCPHCGAPVKGGQAAGAPPMAAMGALGAPAPGQPGYGPPPGYPQPGYPQPGYPQQGYPQQGYPPQPPKSNFVRNCLICSCLAVVLFIGTGVYLLYALGQTIQNSFVQGPEAGNVAQAVLPGVKAPPGWTMDKALRPDFLGVFKAKGVIVENPQNKGMIMLFGAMTAKPENRGDLRMQIDQTLRNINANSGGQQNGGAPPNINVISEVNEEVTVGSGADTQKAQASRALLQNDKGEKIVQYIIVLDPYPNEFGWVAIAAMGKEDIFDAEAFKALLATVTTKKP